MGALHQATGIEAEDGLVEAVEMTLVLGNERGFEPVVGKRPKIDSLPFLR